MLVYGKLIYEYLLSDMRLEIFHLMMALYSAESIANEVIVLALCNCGSAEERVACECFIFLVPVCPSDVAELWNVRRPRLESLGVTLSLDLLTSLSDRDAPHVVCHVSSRLCPGYGTYKLTISPKQVGWKDGLC